MRKARSCALLMEICGAGAIAADPIARKSWRGVLHVLQGGDELVLRNQPDLECTGIVRWRQAIGGVLTAGSKPVLREPSY